MKKIKVLHVAEAAGGVERYLQSLFKYSDNREVENILVCSQNFDQQKFQNLVSRIIVLNMSHDINIKNDIKVERALRHIIKKEKPNVVYGHSSKAGAFVRIADLGIRNRVVYNPHGWAFNMRQSAMKKNMYVWIEKILSLFCNKIICISQAERESALFNKICKESKLEVISNGIDLKEIEMTLPQDRKHLGIPENAFVIGQVGRLSKQKAPEIFVNAARIIKQKIPNAFFLLVGDGEQRIQIEKLINKYELTNSFLITGWVDNPSSYMKIMDVGTLLSRWEGFGLVLPEYMACKVPIVATSVDAIRDIINNISFLVPMDDYTKVAEAIEKLHDKNIRRKIINLEKKTVAEKYNSKRVADQTLNLYKRLLS
ncbi:glycosyltransferase family 4 protein [Lactobacillus gasseri]|uniref:glycosyltransferase family 4 protein n=2 Tax=Lactobacillus gasseri TaxID=1596 RepID=UPI0021BD6446|nr:glycosyltransferase family 4 protein [Lactobacillus gasseri]